MTHANSFMRFSSPSPRARRGKTLCALLLTFILAAAVFLFPCAAADNGGAMAKAALVSKDGELTVKGMQFLEVSDAQVPIELENCAFHAIAADTDVSKWFTNLPKGLTAKIITDVSENSRNAMVSISGFPSARSKKEIAVTIPKAFVTSGADIRITPASTAKYEIIKADYTLMFKNGKLTTTSGAAVNIPGWYIHGSSITCGGDLSFETTAAEGIQILGNHHTLDVREGNLTIKARERAIVAEGNLVIFGTENSSLNIVIEGEPRTSQVYAIRASSISIGMLKLNMTMKSTRLSPLRCGLWSERYIIINYSNITYSDDSTAPCYYSYGFYAGIMGSPFDKNVCTIEKSVIDIKTGKPSHTDGESIGIVGDKGISLDLGHDPDYEKYSRGMPKLSVKAYTRALSKAPIGLSVPNGKLLASTNLDDKPSIEYNAGDNDSYKWVKTQITSPSPNTGEFLLEKLVLGVGKNVKVYNIVTPDCAGNIKWMIDDENVIKITGKGKNAKIKPLKTGATLLTADFGDGTAATIPVTVVEKGMAASKLTLKGKLTLNSGESKTPKFTVGPDTAADKTIKWCTDNARIAVVNDEGRVTAMMKGKCKVYAITSAGARKAVSVTVKYANKKTAKVEVINTFSEIEG